MKLCYKVTLFSVRNKNVQERESKKAQQCSVTAEEVERSSSSIAKINTVFVYVNAQAGPRKREGHEQRVYQSL